MLKRLASFGLTIYVLLVFASKASAEPLSCAGYAVTNSEKQLVEVLQDMNAVKSEMVTIDKQLVEVLQDMNAVKSEMVTIDKQLKDLRSQMDSGYDSSSSESVNRYNQIVNDFNSLVSQRNQLNDKHNSLKDSFNSLVNVTSPSRNTSFVLCMNGEVVAADAATVKLNADSLR